MAYFNPEGVLKISGAAFAGVAGKNNVPATATADETVFCRRALRDGESFEKPEANPRRRPTRTNSFIIVAYYSSYGGFSVQYGTCVLESVLLCGHRHDEVLDSFD